MAKTQSIYQGKRVKNERTGAFSDPVFYIVNPFGSVHNCTHEHCKWRLRSDARYRLATDEEIEQFMESRAQRFGKPIAEPWSPDPEILPYIPPEENEIEELRATEQARELAADKKIDLAEVEGTGAGGQILRRDVLNHIEAMNAPKEDK